MNQKLGPAVFIPAVSKKVPNEISLIRKLSGKSLIQRAIDQARTLSSDDNSIHVITDIEEISLIGKRNGISSHFNPELDWNGDFIQTKFIDYVNHAELHKDVILVLSPFAPLLTSNELLAAMAEFLSNDSDALRPVYAEQNQSFDSSLNTLDRLIGPDLSQSKLVESAAFLFLRPGLLTGQKSKTFNILPWMMSEEALEIKSLRDWWASEKLLQRKRIIFRVIGNSQVGMGHIYRALSLAHEMNDHEILFVSDDESFAAVKELASSHYRLAIYPRNEIINGIIKLEPDLVINDILDTAASDLDSLKANEIVVVNFEDLGTGASIADLTINELYDVPTLSGERFLWGHDYFFVREEFENASPHTYKKQVDAVLLAFGGTDQHNMSHAIYKAVRHFCEQSGIKIHIVTGPGYEGYEELRSDIEQFSGATITHATGVISHIMEQTQVAITSNGRTVYELAHMNIPSIVIPQHEREKTHSFAREDNGFIPLETYVCGKTEIEVALKLEKIISDVEYRLRLFNNMVNRSFLSNKQRVVSKILDCLESSKKFE